MMSVLPLLLLLNALSGSASLEPAAPDAQSPAEALANARKIEQRIEVGELDEARDALRQGTFSPLVRATLEGRLALADGDPTRAAKRFGEASKLAPDHTPLRILRAHALVAAERFDDVFEALEHPDIVPTDPGVALLLARAFEGTHDRDGHGDPAAAYQALTDATNAHPTDLGLRRELVLLCTRYGLYATAHEWSVSMSPAQLGRDVVFVALQHAREDHAGFAFAQTLASAFEDDAQVQAQLGWAASAAGHTRTAAQAFTRATDLGSDLAYVAAEHHRAAGHYRDALRLNARVTAARQRAQQRFDILFEQGAMARAIVAAATLDETPGLSPRRRYSLAYAHYTLRQYAEASAIARKLVDTAQGKRASTLLRAMGRTSP